MPVSKSWSLFRRFRITVLSFVAILCLLWSILIAVYTAKNWSSYEKGQRGVFSGLVALDFLSSILIYLMVVVKYRYWPDAARTAVLIGLHAAGTITVMALKPHLPCNAFGGRSTCNTLTDVIIYGSWTITGFLGSYGVVLPFAAGLPRGTELDLESASDRTADDKPEESRVLEEEMQPHSPTSADVQAWLLQNQEKMSPKMALVEFPRSSCSPRGYSHGSLSLPSTPALSQANARLLPEVANDGDSGIAELRDSAYLSNSSRNSVAQTHRFPSTPIADRPFTASEPSRSLTGSPLPSFDQSERTLLQGTVIPTELSSGYVERSLAGTQFNRRGSAYAVVDGYELPSLYTQPSAAPSRSPTATRRPVSRRHTRESETLPHHSIGPMRGGIDVGPRGIGSHTNDRVDPLLTALPIPDYASRRSAASTTFDFPLSDRSRPPSTDVGELLNIVSGRRPSQARQDSVVSSVDMDEWRKLVLGAAGKA